MHLYYLACSMIIIHSTIILQEQLLSHNQPTFENWDRISSVSTRCTEETSSNIIMDVAQERNGIPSYVTAPVLPSAQTISPADATPSAPEG